jgi:hypothetical protein
MATDLEYLAHHDAGHAAVAVALGGRVARVKIDPSNDKGELGAAGGGIGALRRRATCGAIEARQLNVVAAFGDKADGTVLGGGRVLQSGAISDQRAREVAGDYVPKVAPDHRLRRVGLVPGIKTGGHYVVGDLDEGDE